MTFVVEDGTGVQGATSYVSVAEAESILTDLGYSEFPGETDLSNASFFFDIRITPTSYILTQDQGLLFPREIFLDSQGREVEGIPYDIKRAVSVIAAELMDNDLFEMEPSVRSESYGNSSVTFAGPVSSLPGTIRSQILYLFKLGYGYNSTSQIDLVRA